MNRQAGPIVPIGLEFGAFPEITPLNPRFVPGHPRLKLTLDIESLDGPAVFVSPGIWEALREAFPILGRHRCGDHRTGDAFAGSGQSPASVRAADRDEGDRQVELAHLLEHLIIDCLHVIGAMTTCSGITCAYENPRNRFDLFIESPAPEISRLCVALATASMNDLARGRPLDPVYAGVVTLARRFRRTPSETLSRAVAVRLLGDEGRAGRALEFLRAVGFIAEVDACINFSSSALYEVAMTERNTTGLDLRSA